MIPEGILAQRTILVSDTTTVQENESKHDGLRIKFLKPRCHWCYSTIYFILFTTIATFVLSTSKIFLRGYFSMIFPTLTRLPNFSTCP